MIYRLLEKDAYGLYHAVCGGVCSRYEFARRILTLAGKNTEILKADSSRGKTVIRPMRCWIICAASG